MARPAPSRFPRPRVPRVGRPSGSFTQHRRLDKLRSALEAEPAGLSLTELAAVLQVDPRSVRRYLRELKASTEIEPVETVPGGPLLWRLAPSERGRAVSLRRAQAYGLLASRRVFEVLRGSALFDEVDLAHRQLVVVASRPTRGATKGELLGGQRFEERFVYEPPIARNYAARGEDVDALVMAAAELRVAFARVRPRSGDAKARVVELHPLALVLQGGEAHVIARWADGGALEVVGLDRLADVRVDEARRFELPDGFELGAWLHGAQGVAPPTRSRVVIEFDARVAESVRQRKLHPAQRIATSPDGRVRVAMPLANRAALTALVLAWGDAAAVVEPADLASEVAATLARAAARYG